MKEIREVVGYEIPLAIDHIGHVSEGSVIALAQRLEKYNIAWLEDVAPWKNINILKKISERTIIPVCTGEDIYLAENFEPLMRERVVSVVHPDVLTIGGAMEMKKLEGMCEKYGVSAAVHMAESPIAFMAAVHIAASMKNVFAIEFHSADHPDWFKLVKGLPDPIIKDGFVQVSEVPGLGIEDIDEKTVKKYLHKDYGGYFEDSSEWDKEWSNDREWS